MIDVVHLLLSQRRALLMTICRGGGMFNQLHQCLPLLSELARVLSLRCIVLSRGLRLGLSLNGPQETVLVLLGRGIYGLHEAVGLD